MNWGNQGWKRGLRGGRLGKWLLFGSKAQKGNALRGGNSKTDRGQKRAGREGKKKRKRQMGNLRGKKKNGEEAVAGSIRFTC